jgi:dolichyldiphosphatase
VPQVLCVVYFTLIYASREAEVTLMFAGQLACEAFNFVLKRIIKEERPARMHGKGYGMPSSHAQFLAFWSISMVLFLLVRHRPSPAPRRHHQPLSFAERLTISIGSLVLAALVGWSRVYLNYHTTKQVLAGSLAGSLTAIIWFGITMIARHIGLLRWGLDLPLARWLRFRDLVVEEDFAQSGWEKWEEKIAAETKQSKTKKNR